MSDEQQELDSPTKVVYAVGRPPTLHLRKCKLAVIKGPDKGTILESDKNRIQIGKKTDNDLILSDQTVSRNHVEIRQQPNGYALKDLDSTNGSFIDGMRVREVFLKPGQVFQIGDTEIEFMPLDEKVEIKPSESIKFGAIIGQSVKMREIFAVCEKIAATDATVVIEGETGTGKELIARELHLRSHRKNKPFNVFDCSAVPPNLIESELFGHEKGSFTGASATRQGLFELSHTGSIFLDELGELTLDLQPKLLRVLEQREIRRVGGNRPIKIDVRVIAATNRDLEQEVKKGKFREDLYYRLSVVKIRLPPLRERREDIPLIVEHILEHGQFNQSNGRRKVRRFSDDAMQAMKAYDWPGNVRELVNAIERSVSMVEGEVVKPADLPDPVKAKVGVVVPRASSGGEGLTIDTHRPFKEAKEDWIQVFEKDYVVDLLKRNDQNISRAAREAEIDRKYLRRLIRKYDLKATSAEVDDEEDLE